MENCTDKLKEIETLLSSNTKSHKPFAYSTLLHLQEHSITQPSLIQLLSDSSYSFVFYILIDIADDDEEIAAQALKCLGFMIYHPSIVAAIPGDNANMIVDVLAKVIMTTKIKSVCNLGVWCISIQQFNAPFLVERAHSLLRAIVHALDNPFGSLSTTFEAMQAVMRLATQLSQKMRDMSNIWGPPIYRRLVSADKRERDMSERCLLKITSAICPPPSGLSKALVLDMKKKLIPAMKDLFNHGMKIQTLQAWGWFIRLLGPYAMKHKQLINEMLKIPEQTFTDFDPQVQIASQVAWEGLIDALVHFPIQASERNLALDHGTQLVRTSEGETTGTVADGFLKRLKLIMTPLIGIMSSKCDVSVHSSCLNTWFYLLHKLDTSVNCPSVIKSVWEPIFVVVFRIGPNSKNMWLWNSCVDLLANFTLARNENVNAGLNNQVSSQLSSENSMFGPPLSGKCSWKYYPIKYLPWDLGQLNFFTNMIHILINQGSMVTVAPEIKKLACNAALRIFRFVLKGVQNVLKSSIMYDEVMLCLNSILRFLKKICEDVTSEDGGISFLHHTSIQFVQAVTEELEPSILGSPLYKVAVDLKYIDNLRSVSEFSNEVEPGVCFMDHNPVSPIVYLIILHFCVVVELTSHATEAESILPVMYRNVKFLLSSYDPPEILHVFVGLLYKQMMSNCIEIWITIANCVKDYMDGTNDFSLFKRESDNPSYVVVCHLLSYPFAVCSCPQKRMVLGRTTSSLELSLVSSPSQRKLELQHVSEAWKSLYVSVNFTSQFEFSPSKSFSEDLFVIMNECLDRNTSMQSGNELDPREKNQDLDLLSLWGDVVICVVEQILTTEVGSKGSKNKGDGKFRKSSSVKNSLGFVARFMRLSWTESETNPPTGLSVTSRVFSTLVRFVGCLHWKENIVSFFEIISGPLLLWLSHAKVKDESTSHQLQLLWTEILNCLQMSWPPINFDSSFLEHQGPLLEITLDHPKPLISKPTITFWNSTYGQEMKLDYPQSLLPVLDKLSRNGKIILCKRSMPFTEKCHYRVDMTTFPQKYRVSATQNRSSKRVELVEDTVNGFEKNDKPCLGSKRKRPELTEHQKKVRRAQQGRATDCDGRGPGIRTYTSVDFSQGNEES